MCAVSYKISTQCDKVSDGGTTFNQINSIDLNVVHSQTAQWLEFETLGLFEIVVYLNKVVIKYFPLYLKLAFPGQTGTGRPIVSLCPGTRAGTKIPGQTPLSLDVPGQNESKNFKKKRPDFLF